MNTNPGIKEHVGEWIAILVTVVLSLVLAGFGSVMAWQALHGTEVDAILARTFDMLLLAFVAVWRTNFPGASTTVNTDQANVSSGGGSPSPANVENLTVNTPPAVEEPAPPGGAAVGNGAGAG